MDNPFKTIFNITTTGEPSAMRTKLTENSISKVVNSSNETAVIAATLSVVGMIILATLYGLHYFFKRNRQTMVMPIISPIVPIQDYFTRPKEPMVFENEFSGHNFNQETAKFWHRPLQPVATSTDIYPVVL
ncbi:hypothetical protein GHT06_016298 [Daphnia sinensis]|uniref:Uncharacterized protein n=1 Tax=Daphnia sinensis TaxID=1820382 RepID=A0AAD5KP56_9CRUS|nr:hypothetical protein GHT06_016298 [Daphnia sinensis]